MSNGEFLGMDVEEGRRTAKNMDDHADDVDMMVADVTKQLSDTPWFGPDGDAFRNDWNGIFQGQLQGVVNSLHENAAQLRTYAERQEQVSNR